MKISLGFLLLLALNLNLDAQTARLYAVTFYERRLITIDTNSGAGTLIATLSSSPADIAEQDGKLWVMFGGSGVERLIQLDAWTGATLNQKSFASTASGGEGAFDFAADGTALAAKSSESIGTLFRIDMARTNVVLITADGGLSPSLDGLAFDETGVLYGLSQNSSTGFVLYTVNTNTGATKAVGDLGITFPGTGGAVAGLAFAPDGALFAAAGNPTESRLYRLNRMTGAATLIGSVGLGGVSGIRFFVPPPGPLAIVRQGGLLRLSWPGAGGGVLQSAGSVRGFWTAAMLPLSTNGAEVFTFAPANQNERYFRLAQ